MARSLASWTRRSSRPNPKHARHLASAFDDRNTLPLALDAEPVCRCGRTRRDSIGPSRDTRNNPCRRQGRSRRSLARRSRELGRQLSFCLSADAGATREPIARRWMPASRPGRERPTRAGGARIDVQATAPEQVEGRSGGRTRRRIALQERRSRLLFVDETHGRARDAARGRGCSYERRRAGTLRAPCARSRSPPTLSNVQLSGACARRADGISRGLSKGAPRLRRRVEAVLSGGDFTTWRTD
jgi:hypothetical protein